MVNEIARAIGVQVVIVSLYGLACQRTQLCQMCDPSCPTEEFWSEVPQDRRKEQSCTCHPIYGADVFGKQDFV